ncbi:hypothetical protein FJZ21_00190 [Candidatus Pacearchaeota archaeon]|nr:hypothetical protein [Candidatus Pacearchaeota archaeon]
MNPFFSISLITTFLILRSWAYFGYRANDYFDKKEDPNTLIVWLRIKTGFAWLLIHFGVLIFFMAALLIYFNGLTWINRVVLGISLSIILDQIFPLIGKWYYFGKKMFFVSILLHIITIILAIRFG